MSDTGRKLLAIIIGALGIGVGTWLVFSDSAWGYIFVGIGFGFLLGYIASS